MAFDDRNVTVGVRIPEKRPEVYSDLQGRSLAAVAVEGIAGADIAADVAADVAADDAAGVIEALPAIAAPEE